MTEIRRTAFEETAATKGPLPPYHRILDFLTIHELNDLLKFSIANEHRFKPSTIRRGAINVISPQQRVSVALREFGAMKNVLFARMTAIVPRLIAELRVTAFVPTKVELELVAHGDHAFFKRHIDTSTGADAKEKSARLISAVYYFYSEPKAFAGGALRLYRFGKVDSADDFIDIQPKQNSLIAFPSWASHEVLPIICPSKRFSDSRFAVNCWVHGLTSDKQTRKGGTAELADS
jgi:Rps23 Pro-64 3,4-dihydroxylase Tpa1-like proline 4-hydroxylase